MEALRSLYERMVLGDEPTALWPLETTSDIAEGDAVADTLTFTGTATVASILKDDTYDCRDFDGSDDYATAADSADLDLGDVLTIEAWIRLDALPAEATQFDVIDKGLGAYKLIVATSSGTTRVRLSKSDTQVIVDSTIGLAAATVYHIVVTKNGATVKIYINGVDRTGGVTNATMVDTADALVIGKDNNSAANFFNGKMAWLALYKTALSATRVEQHYKAGSSPFRQLLGDARPSPHLPKVAVLCSFESGPNVEHPKYTLITQWVRELDTHRGRTTEKDAVEIGSAGLTADNGDRRFEPEFSGSPYYPNVIPTRQLHIMSLWAAVQYEHYHGFTEDWPPAWRGKGADSIVSVKAVDALRRASLHPINVSAAQELTGARINRALDTMSIPAGLRSIDPGAVQVIAETLDGQADGFLEEAVAAEGGILFIDGAGRWVFQDREHRPGREYTPRATFGDGAGELPYADLRPKYDDKDIWNDIAVTVAGTGNVKTATDAVSQGAHWPRRLERNLKLVSDADGQATADYLKTRYKDPHLRIPEMDIYGPRSPSALWPVLLAAELSYLYTVKRHSGETDPIDQDQHVEAIGMNVGSGEWSVDFTLSTADGTVYWLLGVVGRSELGVTTRLWL